MFNIQTKLNNAPGSAGRLSAEEFNNFIREMENFVIRAGLLLSEDPANVTQLAESAAIAARSAGIFNDVGAANQVRLIPHAGENTFPLPPSYTGLNGNAVMFRVAFANTGAATLDLGMTSGAMLGERGLVRPNGTALQAGDLQPGNYVTAIYDASVDKWRLAQLGFATEEQFDGHVQDFNNPHNVTLAQLGGASSAALQAHIGNTGNPHNVTLGQLGGAPNDSPNLTGAPQAPTPASNANDARIATTAFTQAAIIAALAGLGMSGGFTQSFADNGWCRLPNGMLLQWGRVPMSGGEGSGPTVTFPVAFPNNALAVMLTNWTRTGISWQGVDCFIQLVSLSPGNFATFVQNPGSSSNFFEGFFWFAVGY